MELRRNKRPSRKAAQLPLWEESLKKSADKKTSTQKKGKSIENDKAPLPQKQKRQRAPRKPSHLEMSPSKKSKKKSEKSSKKVSQKNMARTSSKVSSNNNMGKNKKASVSASEVRSKNYAKSSRGQSTFCMMCKKNFSKKNLLEKHNTKHHFFRHCPNCPKTFRQTRKFILHLRSHLLDHPYECKICLESYNQKKDMLAHKIGHESRTISCDKCPEIFPHLASLNRHRLAHDGPPYPCEDCDAIFSNVPDRTVHTKNHVHRCILCPKKIVAFPTNADLAAHIYLSHRTEGYDQTKLGTIASDEPCVTTGAVQLEDDGESDSMDDLLSSSDCESDSDFDSNYQKDAVEPVYNLKRKDKFICFICYDLYPSCELLKSHMKAHNWFPCNSCPRFFPDADELNKHKCDFAEELNRSPRCSICNSECENCKKKFGTMNVVSKTEDVLQNFEHRFQELSTIGVTNYTDIVQYRHLITFMDYVKSYEGPLNHKIFSLIGFHYGNLHIIINNPSVNTLFPRECICNLEELYSKFQNLIEILLKRNNYFKA